MQVVLGDYVRIVAQSIQIVVKMIPEAHVHRLNRDWEDEFFIAGCTCHGGAKGGLQRETYPHLGLI